MTPPRHIDTDTIIKSPELRRRFQESLVPTEDGCLLFPEASIAVEARGFRHALRISPARLAWAFAHPEDHLGVRDYAVHICEFGTHHNSGTGDPRVCCASDHLVKGTRADIDAMVRARKLRRSRV